MADRGVLGCFGALVGLVVAAVIAWLTLDLALTLWATLGSEGAAGTLATPVLAHQAGQLLVVGTLIAAIFLVVFERIESTGPVTRGLLWTGAALELFAWLYLPGGSRLSLWALVLAILGLIAPLVLERPRRRRT